MEHHNRPLITFTIVAYNQEQYIREAVAAAFAQTYSPLEIVLSDDHSRDATFSIMEQMAADYRGPHKVVCNRNPENFGIGKHVNRIMEISSGEIIVSSAGDDVSHPDRAEKIFDAFERGGARTRSVYSNNIIIDETGREKGVRFAEPVDPALLRLQHIINGDFGIIDGCSHAWKREVFEVFGPLVTPVTCEDSTIGFRSALLGDIVYLHEPLMKHRRHSANTWAYENVTENTVKLIRFQLSERDAILRNWLHDLELMRSTGRNASEELNRYGELTAKRIKENRKEIIAFEGNTFNKIGYILKKAVHGAPISQIRHELGVLIFPKIYNRYMLMRSQHRKAK